MYNHLRFQNSSFFFIGTVPIEHLICKFRIEYRMKDLNPFSSWQIGNYFQIGSQIIVPNWPFQEILQWLTIRTDLQGDSDVGDIVVLMTLWWWLRWWLRWWLWWRFTDDNFVGDNITLLAYVRDLMMAKV